jgi:serine/threonine protein kinase/lipopolysaccharide biosynthesis regulator YciM
MIGKTIHQYRILEKLGEGGMGEVFLADDTELNRKVALKFLSEDYASDGEVLARFKREAQMAAALNHPNIITVYEVGQYEGRPYIAMAYIEGPSLGELIAGKKLSTNGALDIAHQIGDGLSSAHHAGVVHRDIKPDNVMLEHSGRVKILDFGLAKLGGGSKLTGAVSTFGTIYYMSPEQVRGGEVDARSDIFSYGVLLYEMLTGQLPFQGEHSAAIIYSITNEEPRPLTFHNSGLPGELERIVARALAKDPAERYQSVQEMLDALERFRTGSASEVAKPARRLPRYLLPTSAVFVIVALLIFFKPFRFEFTPDQRAVAADNSLAIMYFENVVNPDDSQRLGEIVTNLLITDLSESEYLDVVSGQRLYDILKLQGREGEKVIDRSTATEVASHAGAKWMLLGSILQEEPSLIVTSQLVDVKTGKVSASQRITGEPGEKIFSLVDKLTSEIKQDLALPAAAAREQDAPVSEVTTHSTEAYRYYLEGMDYVNKYYAQEARASFQKALEYDSTFAMVYLRQASDFITGSRADRKRAIATALRHSDRVSKKEKRYIASADARLAGDIDKAIAELESLIEEYPNEKNAYKALGDIYRESIGDAEQAITHYRRAIEIDPMDKFSYNVLAYQYQAIGDIDNYIWAIYQYMSLAPDEANPYDSRGDLYAYSGKIDKAIKSYEKALERKPDFYPSQTKIGHMYLLRGDYDEAREAYTKLVVSDDADTRAVGRTFLALIPLGQGRLKAALDALDRGIEGDRAEGYNGLAHAQKYRYKALTYAARRDYTQAIAETQKGYAVTRQTNPDDSFGWLALLAHLYAADGDYDQSQTTLGGVRTAIEEADKSQMRFHQMTKGVIELESGDASSAVASLESAGMTNPLFYFDYHLAKAYLEAGRLPDAIARFEMMARRFSEDRAEMPILAAKCYYYLGLAYEESGRGGKAIEQYTTFLNLWQNADPGIAEVEDTRERLARLNRS